MRVEGRERDARADAEEERPSRGGMQQERQVPVPAFGQRRGGPSHGEALVDPKNAMVLGLHHRGHGVGGALTEGCDAPPGRRFLQVEIPGQRPQSHHGRDRGHDRAPWHPKRRTPTPVRHQGQVSQAQQAPAPSGPDRGHQPQGHHGRGKGRTQQVPRHGLAEKPRMPGGLGGQRREDQPHGRRRKSHHGAGDEKLGSEGRTGPHRHPVMPQGPAEDRHQHRGLAQDPTGGGQAQGHGRQQPPQGSSGVRREPVLQESTHGGEPKEGGQDRRISEDGVLEDL